MHWVINYERINLCLGQRGTREISPCWRKHFLYYGPFVRGIRRAPWSLISQLWAFVSSQNHSICCVWVILWYMGPNVCVKCQRRPLKFHTTFWTLTSQNMHFTRCNFFSQIMIYYSYDILLTSYNLKRFGDWQPVRFVIGGFVFSQQ